MSLTGKGTSMVLGTKTCIHILTWGTLTRVPARYTHTHDLPYRCSNFNKIPVILTQKACLALVLHLIMSVLSHHY